MLVSEVELLSFSEAPDRLALSVQAQPRAALSIGRDAQAIISDILNLQRKSSG
jgi:hypothetical protein